MKIIKVGWLKSRFEIPLKRKLRCWHCMTLFEAERNDCETKKIYSKRVYFVKCPICGWEKRYWHLNEEYYW